MHLSLLFVLMSVAAWDARSNKRSAGELDDLMTNSPSTEVIGHIAAGQDQLWTRMATFGKQLSFVARWMSLARASRPC